MTDRQRAKVGISYQLLQEILRLPYPLRAIVADPDREIVWCYVEGGHDWDETQDVAELHDEDGYLPYLRALVRSANTLTELQRDLSE